MENPMWTGNLPRLAAQFAAGRGRATLQQRALGQAMLDRLAAAHDGTRDGVLLPHVPWEEWDGYCAVLDDRTGG